MFVMCSVGMCLERELPEDVVAAPGSIYTRMLLDDLQRSDPGWLATRRLANDHDQVFVKNDTVEDDRWYWVEPGFWKQTLLHDRHKTARVSVEHFTPKWVHRLIELVDLARQSEVWPTILRLHDAGDVMYALWAVGRDCSGDPPEGATALLGGGNIVHLVVGPWDGTEHPWMEMPLRRVCV